MKIDIGFLKEAVLLVPLIVAAVKSVERLFRKDPNATPDANNRARQDAAVDTVGDLLPLLESWIDKDVVDDALVQGAVREVIDAQVALFNVIRDVKAKRLAALAAQPPA